MPRRQISIPTNQNPKAADYDNFSAKRGRPILFQISDPVYNRPLYPVLLALHVNPESMNFRMQKTDTVVMSYGGFIEFLWPEELDSISADGTSGAFISPKTGLTAGSPSQNSRGRQGTIAWERLEDLIELFRSNGQVFNGSGQPVLRGRVLCIHDMGIYSGYFTNLTVNETDDKAFTMRVSWEFKVEQTVFKFPDNARLQGENDISSFSESVTPVRSPISPVTDQQNGQALASDPRSSIDITKVGLRWQKINPVLSIRTRYTRIS